MCNAKETKDYTNYLHNLRHIKTLIDCTISNYENIQIVIIDYIKESN